MSDDQCAYGLQCARRIGAKYGFDDKASVCIPKYDEQQIRFGPKRLLSGQRTNMIFVEGGTSIIPRKAWIRLLAGDNVGCMGAWDDTTTIWAETTLARQSDHIVRPVGRPVEEDLSYSMRAPYRYDKKALQRLRDKGLPDTFE